MGTFHRANEQNIIEVIDEYTGQVVGYQTEYNDLDVKEGSDYLVVKKDGKEFFVEKTLEEKKNYLGVKSYPYSKVLADIICQKISEGKSLTKICGVGNIPPYDVVQRWLRKDKDFQAAFSAAKAARAEHFRDKALMVADQSEKDNIRLEAYKWAASVDNPEVYGNKTKVSGDATAEVSFVIKTGVDKGNQEKDVTGSGGESDGRSEATVHNIESSADSNSSGNSSENIDS